MNKILLFVFFAMSSVSCTKVSDYVGTIIPALKREESEFVQKVAPNLCPADKPTAQVIEGDCDGDWTTSYDADSKTYTCSYTHKTTVTCPTGTVSIGQPSACGRQVDQHSNKSVTQAKCAELFSKAVRITYRLVCCT